jgi:hypothetical protein
MTAELQRHVGHRTTLLDDRRLRCLDCTQTVLLPIPAGSTSTSSSPIPGHGEPRCPQHPHEHAGNCRPCAADAKALDVGPDPKPLAGWAASAGMPAHDRTRPQMPKREPERETSAT